MKVTVFGDKLKNQEKINKVLRLVSGFEGTCFVSEKKTKPNGVWQRRKEIDEDGVWFYKFNLGHVPTEIWKRVGESDQVVLLKGFGESNPAQKTQNRKISMQPPRRNPYLINKDGEEETLSDGICARKDGNYEFYLSEKYHPVAFGNKVLELIETGWSVNDAKALAATTPVCMELYYETGKGLFMVECNAVESGKKIYSPYTKKAYKNNEKL